MKQIKQVLLILLLSIVFPFGISFAHPGNTDASGCHTCRTNCASWGLSYGEYHCHNSKGVTQPTDPIRSHYGENGTGWTESWPEYNNTPTVTCPLFSSYDSISKGCKCNSGYIVQNGSCVSAYSYCSNKYGSNARYNSLTESCECYSGYAVKNGRCVSLDSSCQDSLGFSSSYNSLTDKCECSYGYIIDNNQCVNGNTYCHNNYGYNSDYDTLTKKCECDSGYVFDNNYKCVSHDDSCENNYGSNSKYDYLTDKCVCKDDYFVNNNRCIDGNSYCILKYGNNIKYDSIKNNCSCNYGYVFNESKCIKGDEYCHNLLGNNSNYNSFLNNCECESGYELNGSACEKKKVAVVNKQQAEVVKAVVPIVNSVSSEPVKNNVNSKTFNLSGNEKIRSCGGFDCEVIKFGSTGSASVVDTSGDWTKIKVGENGTSFEGWINNSLVPEGFKSVKQEVTVPANKVVKENSFIKFFKNLFNYKK